MASVAALCVLVFALLTLAAGKHIQDGDDKDSAIGSGLKLIVRIIEMCEKDKDTAHCLKVKALKFVDRAISAESISLMDGVALVQTADAANDSRAGGSGDVNDAALVDDMLVDRVARFFESHAVQINVPKLADGKLMEVGSFFQEGRGKHYKKLMGPLILGVMWKAGLLALSFKAVALIAGKALLVANVALVLAAVLGLKKLFSSQHHEKVTYEIVKSPHVSHGYAASASSPIAAAVAGTAGWEAAGGGYDTSAQTGHYRSYDVAQAKNYADAVVYHAQTPTHVQHVVVPRPVATSHVLVGARKAD